MTNRVTYITFAILVLLLFAAYIVKFVYADEMGTGLGTGLGAGGGTVTGPVTPSGHFLVIDGSSHYLIIDGASNKLKIDGT
jgi:hypothetical protein